ncbi:metal-dependent transcriptional regulator [Clostridium frigidicarnis]|uniref:Manganese transport regulator n=1 Tax=Clostridium frigidicarnis TaxID=84698 RepID=A0A1I1B104_9CLOT|nr:iron dependent repressor, metal binding and dimerization domain protein [Clostridium frigidicarnis]SFB42358.1 Mn-dependent transcriptional regulator, DtxR family [Clostridium frigidicarnis]
MVEEHFYTFSSYLKDFDLSPNEEDYVEMIYRLSLDNNGIVRVKQIADALNVKAPSVTRMISKLKLKSILTNERYGSLQLTELGRKIGSRLLYRHNTIEKFLKIIGETDNILEKTEKIEHVISEDTLKSIDRLVSYLDKVNYK